MTRGNQREVARKKAEKRKHEKGVVSLLLNLDLFLRSSNGNSLLTFEEDFFRAQTVANLHAIWNRDPRTPCPAVSISVQESNRQPSCKRNSEKVQLLSAYT